MLAPLPWTSFIKVLFQIVPLQSIAKADGPRHLNSNLYDCLLRACTNGLCIHNPNDEYVPHQTLVYTAAWQSDSQLEKVDLPTRNGYIERDKLHAETLLRIVTELVAIV